MHSLDTNSLYRISTSGVVQGLFMMPQAGPASFGVKFVVDGAGTAWASECYTGKLRRVSDASVVATDLTGINQPFAITLGSDGAVWTLTQNFTVNRTTAAGATTTYTIPMYATTIAAGKRGSVWIAGREKAYRIASDGTASALYPLESNFESKVIRVHSDALVWVLGSGNRLARIRH